MRAEGEKLDGRGCRRCWRLRVECWQLPTESPPPPNCPDRAGVSFGQVLVCSFSRSHLSLVIYYLVPQPNKETQCTISGKRKRAHDLPASQPQLLFPAINEIGIDGHCDTLARPSPAGTRCPLYTSTHLHRCDNPSLQSLPGAFIRAQTACRLRPGNVPTTCFSCTSRRTFDPKPSRNNPIFSSSPPPSTSTNSLHRGCSEKRLGVQCYRACLTAFRRPEWLVTY